jgi:hypothetical protein
MIESFLKASANRTIRDDSDPSNVFCNKFIIHYENQLLTNIHPTVHEGVLKLEISASR